MRLGDRVRSEPSPDAATYPYSGIGYANPDAVTQIANGLSTSTFTYDNNGNLTLKTTDGTTTTYVYDYANRLTALGVGGATTTYGYDWAGNRVYQTGTTTTYLFPFKWFSVASSTGIGAKFATTTDYVFNGDTLLSTVDQQTASSVATGTTKTRYVHPDHLNSTNVVTDENGSAVQTLDFYPYGATRISVATSTNERRKFIGQFTDDSTLSYLTARYYDSSRGQFLSQDPVFLADPKKQNLQNPQSLNAYSYADDNPITGKDPDGLALTAAQNGQLNAIKYQLLGIQAQLNALSGSNASPGNLSSLQQSVNLAGAAISKIAIGANATISYGYQWSPPLAHSNTVTNYLPYISGNGISAVPQGNDPNALFSLGNLALTGLSATPIGPEGPDELLVAGKAGDLIERNGFKFTKDYYQYLWNTGRQYPGLRVQDIIESAGKAVPDTAARNATDFVVYEYNGWRVVIDPVTKFIQHLGP